jgi:hypothetical protein
MNSRRTRNAYVAAAPQSRNTKKSRGGPRKSLERLDAAKEMEGINLDFLPEKLGFPSEGIWISFIAPARRALGESGDNDSERRKRRRNSPPAIRRRAL